MSVLRTPDERFVALPGFAFQPHYLTQKDQLLGDLRQHYVDEGQGETVLLLHGEPSWSYLYRHMIPPLVAGGCRAIAPDLIGFGRSDKPPRIGDYSYSGHVAWMREFVEQLNLQNITLVCQDWGSLIGLRLVADMPERFARVVLANGALPDGSFPLPAVFFAWRKFARLSPWFPIGRIIQGGTVHKLPSDVVAAYDAPFPSSAFKAGARAFPRLVPASADDPEALLNRNAWAQLEQFDKPFLTAFSDRDPIMRGGDRMFQERVPGARGQAHTTVRGGGHFLQEDCGPELANITLDFMRANPLSQA